MTQPTRGLGEVLNRACVASPMACAIQCEVNSRIFQCQGAAQPRCLLSPAIVHGRLLVGEILATVLLQVLATILVEVEIAAAIRSHGST